MKALALAAALALPTVSCASSVPKAAAAACVPQAVAKKVPMTLPSGDKIRVAIVDNPTTREIGLMCVTKLPKNYGMLFVFPQDMFLNFWMKNTLVPLDIIWIGADKRITVIHEKLHESTVETPEDKIVTAGGKGQYVLELASGEAGRRKLKPGDLLKFSTPIPEK
jgi:uncharacterized membrane protein (UPF0127 family)